MGYASSAHRRPFSGDSVGCGSRGDDEKSPRMSVAASPSGELPTSTVRTSALVTAPLVQLNLSGGMA